MSRPFVNDDVRVTAWREQVGNYTYDLPAEEFIRFRADTVDDQIAGVLRGVTSAGSDACADFRSRLDVPASATLRLFAMRRTLQGRRQASLGLLSESMDAYALLPHLNDVPWDSWLKATLFVARDLGGDLASIGARFADVASDRAVARADVAGEAMDRVEDLSQCHLVDVTTTYGTGFVEILVFRNTPTVGLFGAPTRLGVNQVEYRPTSNLAQLAVNLADALDASSRVKTSPIGQDQLAATSFSRMVAGSYLATIGCLSFVADEVNGSSSFTVFVAELPEDVDTEELAGDASSEAGQVALFDARRVVLLSPQPNFDDESAATSELDLHDFEDLARAAMLDPATASWAPH